MLKSGNILTIESEGYETLYLRVIKATADTFTVKKTDSDAETPSAVSYTHLSGVRIPDVS